MAALPTHSSDSWRAELQLGFARQGTRTTLARRKHTGPLVVQRPFYPEGDVCHVYLVHPPGGIVGGDQLRLRADLEPASHAVITTPAATKFYRTRLNRCATLEQTLQLSGATLEWLPQETIVFRDAKASTATRVQLDKSSRFIGWEITCYGRPAGDELFDSGGIRQQFELWLDDQPILLDRLRIDGNSMSMQAPWGLASSTVLGTLLAYPATPSDLDVARGCTEFACTLVDKVLSCRLVGKNSHTAKQAFIRLWQQLRPRLLQRDAVLPRIWST